MSRRTCLSFRVVLFDFRREKMTELMPFHAISRKPFKEILREKFKNNLMARKEPVPIFSILKPWEMAGASHYGSSTLRSPNAVEEVCRLGLFRSAMPFQFLSRNSVNIGRAGLRRVRLGVLFIVFVPECVARVPVSLWGSGGWGCVRSTLRLRPQPFATVRNRPQPFATVRVMAIWPCLW